MGWDLLKQLEQHPSFSGLSYNEQTELRAKAFMKAAESEASYNSLDLKEKEHIYRKYVFKAPKFQDKLLENMIKAEGEKYTQGDEATRKEVHSMIWASPNAKQGLLTGLVTKATLGIADMSKDEQIRMGSHLTRAVTIGPESEKVQDYYSYLTSTSDQTAKIGRSLKSLGTLTGLGVDIYAMYANPLIKGFRGANSRFFKGLVGGSKSKALSWAVGIGAASIAETTVEGLVGVLRDNLLKIQNGEATEIAAEGFKGQARSFGQWAALDYLINLSVDTIVPWASLGIRTIAGKKVKRVADIGSEAFKKNLNSFLDGDMPNSVWDQLSPAKQEHFTMVRQVNEAAKMGKSVETDAFLKHVIPARSSGYSLVKIDDGFKLRNTYDIDEVLIAKNANELTEQVSEIAYKQYSNLVGENKKAFKDVNEWVLNHKLVPDAIDAHYNPVKEIDSSTKQGAKKARDLNRRVRAGGYTPIDERYIVTQGEASEIIKKVDSRGKYQKLVSIPLQPDDIKKLEKGITPYKEYTSTDINLGGSDKNALVTLNKVASYDDLVALDARAKRLKDLGDPRVAEEIRRSLLIEEGFDGAFVDKANKSIKVVYPDKIKYLDGVVNPATGKSTEYIRAVSSKPKKYKIVKTAYKATIGKDILSKNDEAFVDLLSRVEGNVNSKSVKSLADFYLEGAGVKTKGVSVRLTDNPNGFVFSRKVDGADTLFVPRNIDTPTAKENFVNSFLEQVDEISLSHGGEKAKLDRAVKAYKKLSNVENVYSVPNIPRKQQIKWVSDLVDGADGTIQRTADGFQVTLPGVAGPLFVDTLDEVTDIVLKSQVTPNQLKMTLAQDGKMLLKTSDGYKVFENGKEIASNPSLFGLMDDVNIRPKIDNAMAPDVVTIGPEGAEFNYEKDYIVATNSSARKFMNQFADYNELDRVKKIANVKEGTIYKDVNKSFLVDMPDYGIKQQFSSLEEARKFLTSDWKEMHTLKDIGLSKGIEIEYRDSKFVINDNGKVLKANSVEELGKIFRNEYPDPQGLKELADQEVMKGANEIPITGKFSKVQKMLNWVNPSSPKGMGVFSGLSAAWRPMDAWLINAVKKTGLTELGDIYRDVEKGLRFGRSEAMVGENLLKDIFSENGKVINQKRMKKLYYYITNEVPGAKAEKIIGDLKLTDKDLVIADRVREFFGKDVNSGLFSKFGMDPQKFLTDYAPRIRDYANLNIGRLNEITIGELTSHVFKNDVPKEVRFWAENQRASELINMSVDDDILSVSLKYNNVGHKKLFLDESWKRLDEYLVNNRTKIPPEVELRMNEYREKIMGVHLTDGEKMVQNFGTRLAQKMFPGDARAAIAGKDIMKTAYSLNYLTTMGWRPWLGIRNLHDIWTKLGPRFGNTLTAKAMKYVAQNADEVIGQLKRTGIIGLDDPIMFTKSVDSAIGNITHKSLKSFKRSDDITRAVAWQTAKIQFDDAITKLKRGVFKTDMDFLEYSGINLIAPDEAINALSHVKKGNLDAALDVYGKSVVEETMFAYRASQSPSAFNGVVGKAFGQYGTYTNGFREHLVKGFTRGSVSQRIAFGARYMSNIAAIGLSLKAIGIDGRNFLPFAPVMFTGGPMFDMGITAIRSTGSSYKSDISRAELPKQLANLVPGSYQFRAVKNFLDYSDKGESWNAFLSLTTAPIHPENR